MTASPRQPAPDDSPASDERPLARGRAVILASLPSLPSSPGVYRMISAKGDVLYVGKAKNLNKRVASYAIIARQPTRTLRMVAQTASIEVVSTHTEVEALLLEANLIKRLRPRYNILLRDDKSFPYILITGDDPWPRITKHRGARKRDGEYFGPFASAGAVNQTINALARAFPLRSCSDSMFASRSRPCLQYQIKRCTAPCVGRIEAADYRLMVDEVRDFLSGRNRQVQERLVARMEAASAALEFETAAIFRDRVRALTQIQAKQEINVTAVGEADVIAVHQEGGQTCVELFFFRAGQNFGNRAYFPSHSGAAEPGEILGAFLGQFYQNKQIPKLVLVSHAIPGQRLLEDALTHHAGHRVRVVRPLRGDKRKLIDHALANAGLALARKLSESAAQRLLLEGLADRLGLDAAPRRIEVYDNSHVSGTHAVGGMIVAGPAGFMRNAYRKFTIRGGPAPGDDYAMMREVLTRRLTRLLKETPSREDANWPDLLIIDGGKGHLGVARQVFDDLGMGDGDLAVVAIAKGPDRNAGRERLFLPGKPVLILAADDPVLYFLQRLRDEAHRFAIGAHRAKRSKAAGGSPLDDIPGIGPRRKRALLNHFGSARGVSEAGLADLECVDGISTAVASRLYDYFRA
ncbi:MAG: excinuclease ABC subunit UvrC [Proteobacteria bacterium]|nr:excinuclease ABC subunit UvrC [Pseudomonadota bacterium]